MNRINSFKVAASFLLIATFYFASCNKDDHPAGNQLPAEIKLVNDFIYQNTNSYYLWTEFIPKGINLQDYPNPMDLFNAMYYPKLDNWSFVTDDYKTVLDGLSGSRKTTGFRLKLFQYEASENLFGVIEYVYSGGPANLAGIKRGDVLLKINGQALTKTNYQDLLSSEAMQLGLGEMVNNTIVDSGKTVGIAQTEMTIHPVLQSKVISRNSINIGYLLYDQFIEDFFSELQFSIENLKSQNINELVLDLRYNPGGHVLTCNKLASMLAPSTTSGNIFSKHQWNMQYTSEIIKYQGNESELLVARFPKPSVSLNLKRLYVITSQRTASASELLINCLKPYMEVVLIGDKTVGKYTGASFFYSETHAHNWGLYLVMSKIANANGETDYVDGFIPDYQVKDDYYTPLGDESEPLLAKAISLITNIPTKSTISGNQKLKPYASFFNNRMEKDGMMVLEY